MTSLRSAHIVRVALRTALGSDESRSLSVTSFSQYGHRAIFYFFLPPPLPSPIQRTVRICGLNSIVKSSSGKIDRST